MKYNFEIIRQMLDGLCLYSYLNPANVQGRYCGYISDLSVYAMNKSSYTS